MGSRRRRAGRAYTEGVMGSEFFFSQPSLLSGIGRTIDLWGVYEEFNDAPTSEIADGRAVYSDWRMVGQDLESATEAVVDERGRPLVEEGE